MPSFLGLLQDYTAFNLDTIIAGKSKQWQFWNCEPSSFPYVYDTVEHLYMLAGKFTIQYEGAEPVTIVAGDFVGYPSLQVECLWSCLEGLMYKLLVVQ